MSDRDMNDMLMGGLGGILDDIFGGEPDAPAPAEDPQILPHRGTSVDPSVPGSSAAPVSPAVVVADDGVDRVADQRFHNDVQALNAAGYAAPDTDPNDPMVITTVKAFQGDMGIGVDGFIGPETRAAIQRVLAHLNAPADPLPAPDQPGGLKPASTTSSGPNLKTIAIIGALALGLVGVAYYAAGKD